jgi:hypothetical protein
MTRSLARSICDYNSSPSTKRKKIVDHGYNDTFVDVRNGNADVQKKDIGEA